MGSPLNYSNSIVDHRLRQLAEAIESNGLSLYSVLLKAAMKTDLVASTFNAINEDYTRKQVMDKWKHLTQDDDEPVSRPQAPAGVSDLTATLKNIVGQLATKYGMDDHKINTLVSQAVKDARNPGVGTYTAAAAYPAGMKAEKPIDVGAGSIDPELAKKLGLGTWNYGDEEEDDENPAHVEKESLPSWFGDMTKGEQEWYSKLTPNQRRQFIARHDQTVRGDNDGFGTAGNKYLTGDDLEQAKALANQRQRPWMKDKDATLRASAGLLNRHKIRQRLQKDIEDWRDEDLPSLPAFDDLLHKDHHKRTGGILNEWCHLAGIKENKKKAKKRGR